MNVNAYATAELEAWRAQGLERHPATFRSAQLPEAHIDGHRHSLWSSSNYLGLTTHPTVVDAARRALEHYGVGSGGSRLTTGTTELHHEAERACARFVGYDSAVLFATGFQANVSTLQVLAGPDLTIVSDAKNHASIIDGCRLAKAQGATLVVTEHGDTEAVARALQSRTTERALVVTDGVFSMDGTLGHVDVLLGICRSQGAALMVDDAHGVGTVGAIGRGVIEHFGLVQDKPDILTVTASKALGAEGAFIATSSAMAQLLRQRARGYVYSTSLSPSVCAAIIAAFSVLDSADSPVTDLRCVVTRLADALEIGEWHSPIIPVPIGPEHKAVEVARQLANEGIFAPAIRWPTVPRGAAIIRITAMATHTEQQIDDLVCALQRAGRY